MDKVTFKLPLRKTKELKGIKNPERVKKEIGDYILEEILDHVGGGKSPVTGRAFKSLNKKYADNEKGGDRNPNLELNGDMLDSLKVKVLKDGIEIGIWGKEAPKADGHNNHSGKSQLPERRFIPKDNESFKRGIMKEVETIIEEYKDE